MSAKLSDDKQYAGYTFQQARKCDWTEDFTHENGNYWNVCATCERQFVGHKRRVTCKLCATVSAELEKPRLMPGQSIGNPGTLPREAYAPSHEGDSALAAGVLKLTATVRYLVGIAERGEGRQWMSTDETAEQFVLRYVQRLERASPTVSAIPQFPDCAVRLALKVLLNHVEPGWENCRAVVQKWLDGSPESASTERTGDKHGT